MGLPAYVEDLPATTYDGKNDTGLPLVRLAQGAVPDQGNKTFMTSLVDHGYLQGHSSSLNDSDDFLKLRSLRLDTPYGQDTRG